MNQVIVYCGNWCKIPSEVKQSVIILSQVYETAKMMSKIGRGVVYDTIDQLGYDRKVFTNNENAFNGMRLGVKEIGKRAAENLSFIFYDDKGTAHRIKLDTDGNLAYGVPLGFFDQSMIDLLELF